jgi:hypothetical protein
MFSYLIIVLGLLISLSDPKQPFKQVDLPRIAVGDKDVVLENQAEMNEYFKSYKNWPKTIPIPNMSWQNGQVLVVLIIKCKKEADIKITSVQWDDNGLACDVRFKKENEREMRNVLEIVDEKTGKTIKALKANYVDYSIGIITKRPRQKPTVVHD